MRNSRRMVQFNGSHTGSHARIMEDRQANMMIDGQELAATGRESTKG